MDEGASASSAAELPVLVTMTTAPVASTAAPVSGPIFFISLPRDVMGRSPVARRSDGCTI
jgi:hypothetical protein